MRERAVTFVFAFKREDCKTHDAGAAISKFTT